MAAIIMVTVQAKESALPESAHKFAAIFNAVNT